MLYELAVINHRTKNKKNVQGYGFLSFARKYEKQLLNTGLDAVKTASTKVANKKGEFIVNKIADTVTLSNNNKIEKQGPVEEIIILLEKREEILNHLRQVLL